MLPGRRVTAVFGFATINDFNALITCLEEDACTFINTVAKIVHDCVATCCRFLKVTV